jgi:hypothetical protein
MTLARITLCLTALWPLPLAAQDLATGDAIRAALAGNTVRGAMVASGGFVEYYAPDGTIRAADYSGAWTIKGNRMCFGYDGNPPSCWGVRLSGRQVVWVGTGGDEGTGTILPGNPNAY